MCQIYKNKVSKASKGGIDKGLLKMGGHVNIAKELVNKS